MEPAMIPPRAPFDITTLPVAPLPALGLSEGSGVLEALEKPELPLGELERDDGDVGRDDDEESASASRSRGCGPLAGPARWNQSIESRAPWTKFVIVNDPFSIMVDPSTPKKMLLYVHWETHAERSTMNVSAFTVVSPSITTYRDSGAGAPGGLIGGIAPETAISEAICDVSNSSSRTRHLAIPVIQHAPVKRIRHDAPACEVSRKTYTSPSKVRSVVVQLPVQIAPADRTGTLRELIVLT